jgi:hypothetical protein
MVNGRLYDAEQMNEIGNYDKPRGKFFWELDKNAGTFPWHQHTGGVDDQVEENNR